MAQSPSANTKYTHDVGVRSGRSFGGGTRSGTLAVRILFLARVIRCPAAVLLCGNASVISATVRPDSSQRRRGALQCGIGAGDRRPQLVTVHLVRVAARRAGKSTSGAASDSVPGRTDSRHGRSSARLRATVSSNAPGLSGAQSRDQLRSHLCGCLLAGVLGVVRIREPQLLRGSRLAVRHQAHVDALVDEVVLATGQVLHVPVVVLFVGGSDRRVFVGFQPHGPDTEGLDVVIAQ